ncbi:hypothetical protein V1517DRAFT_245871, partial [Lipomyces orientalis]
LLNIYTVSAFGTLGGALFGFNLSSISGIIGTEQCHNYYGNPLRMRQGATTSAMVA